MIKINLVGEARKPIVAKQTKSRGPFLEQLFAGENAAFYWLLVPLLLALVGGGAFWWKQNGIAKENRRTIAEKQRRVDELAEIIARVEAYEAQEEELKRKIDVITELKDNQSGPVEMMDVVSRALPELLWVDRLDQNGQRIQIDGRSFNIGAVSTFVGALDDSSFFAEPELRDTTQRGDVYTYRITLVRQATADLEEAEAP